MISIDHSCFHLLHFFFLSPHIFTDLFFSSIFFLYSAGEPQEECIHCGKMYILSSDTGKGACGKCLGLTGRDQIKTTPFRSSGESCTEEEEDEGEESSNGGTEFSDK